MPDVVVLRGAGDSQGPDVVDALLTSDQACLARGAMVLDESSGLRSSSLDILFRPGLRLGQVVEIYDPLVTGLRYGKITNIAHRLSRVGVDTQIRMVVPSEFVL